MGTTCCYTDARWSPDGSYILFAFQDINQGNNARTQLYYISYGTLGTGTKYTPLPLPDLSFPTRLTIRNRPCVRPSKPFKLKTAFWYVR